MSEQPHRDTGLTPFEAAVAAVLADLTPGEVVTYGEVAAEAGHPGAHRAVGRWYADTGLDSSPSGERWRDLPTSG